MVSLAAYLVALNNREDAAKKIEVTIHPMYAMQEITAMSRIQPITFLNFDLSDGLNVLPKKSTSVSFRSPVAA